MAYPPPLHKAAIYGQQEAVKFLLKNGGKISEYNVSLMVPHDHLCRRPVERRCIEIVRFLLDRDLANPDKEEKKHYMAAGVGARG